MKHCSIHRDVYKSVTWKDLDVCPECEYSEFRKIRASLHNRIDELEAALARATSDATVTRVMEVLGIEVPMGSFPGQKQEGWVGAMQPWADAAKSVAKALKGEVK